MRKNWRTSLCGLASLIIGLANICLGVWIWQAVYVQSNTLWFNLCYVVSGAISIIMAGVGLVVVGIGLMYAGKPPEYEGAGALKSKRYR